MPDLRVALFKSEAASAKNGSEDPYVKALEERGFRARVIPVLQFGFVNLEELGNQLKDADSFSCLALTSPRAAEAVGKAIEQSGVGDRWRRKKVFAVGVRSCAAARRILGVEDVKGENSGSADKLAEEVRKSPSLIFVLWCILRTRFFSSPFWH